MSVVFALGVFLASLTPAPIRGVAVVATASILQAFAIEGWTAWDRGRRPDFGRALTRLPMVFAMDVVVAAAVVLGFLLLIFPGIYLQTRLAFVSNFVVLEGHGWSSLAASRALARGRGWTILGLILPAVLLSLSLPALRVAVGDTSAIVIGAEVVEGLLQTWSSAAQTALFLALSPRRPVRAAASVSALRTPAAPR